MYVNYYNKTTHLSNILINKLKIDNLHTYIKINIFSKK